MPMYQPEIETMSQEQIRKLQSERLVKQVRHVYDNVPYYRAKMEEKGITPEDIHGVEDLHKLPFLTKSDLRDAYPYGLLATPLQDCVRIHPPPGPQAGAWWHSIPSTMWTSGRIAAPGPLWPLAAPQRMWSMSPMAMVCSPAVPACMAAPTRWAA